MNDECQCVALWYSLYVTWGILQGGIYIIGRDVEVGRRRLAAFVDCTLGYRLCSALYVVVVLLYLW